MTNYKGEVMQLTYNAKGAKTGLTDVKLHLWDPANVKVLAGVTMTELANGKYRYSYTPTVIGNYTGYINSATYGRRVNVEFRVVAVLRQGVGGGGLIYPIWSKGEKERVMSLLEEIQQFIKKQKKSEKNFSVKQADFQHSIASGISSIERENSNLRTEVRDLTSKIKETNRANELRDKVVLELASPKVLAEILDKDDEES